MLNKTFRIMLSLTAVCPVLLSLAYVEYFRACKTLNSIYFFTSFVFIIFIAKYIIKSSKKHLEPLNIKIKKAKSTDKEVISFCISYALPVIFRSSSASDIYSWLFAALILCFVLWMTSAMPANPVLGLLGFHFYEVDLESGVGYVLITKKNITHIKQIERVVQIGDYGLLEV